MAFHWFKSGSEKEGAEESEEKDISFEFMDKFPGGLFRYKAYGVDELDFVNSGLLEMFGCADFDEFRELTGNRFSGMVHPLDLDRVQAEIEDQINDGNEDHVQYRIVKRDGEIRWVVDYGHLVSDADGQVWFYVTLLDITDYVNEHQQLLRATERLELITALSNDVLFDIDCQSGKTDVFGDFERRFGRSPKQEDFVVHRRCQKECSLDITEYDLSYLMDQVNENSLVDFETSTTSDDGDDIWYRYQSVVLYDEGGSPVRHVGRLLDTHDMAMRESQFRRKAERDSLTGLFNRAAALNRVETALKTVDRPCTFIIVDIDDFKAVNDKYGHPEGDFVLTQVADFLKQVMRKEDVVARMGGDEFAVFAMGLEPGVAMNRILDHLARGPFATQRATDTGISVSSDIGSLHAAPTFSIGAACCMAPPMAFEELYAVADAALYAAKSDGKACYKLQVIG